jgi:N-acetylneuraminic acid mutarotase
MHTTILAQETWTPTSISNAPSGRSLHTAVWTGSKMIIWGGDNNYGYLRTGGVYDPVSNTWFVMDSINAPTGRYFHTAVWAGSKMLVWGGRGPIYQRTGKAYDLVSNSWTQIDTANAPSAREMHTAVWTGSKMIIWGGSTAAGKVNTGGIYDPVLNIWTTMSTNNAPSPRSHHTAVWTGTKMIVWGGDSTYGSLPLKTGGVYDPVSNTWTTTSLTNCPVERDMHSAVWTGNKMIVWGGYNNSNGYLFSGGQYDPLTDSWTATSENDAPLARGHHTVIWTGSKMVIWGGANGSGSNYLLNSGGIYNPTNDFWDSTTTTNAPAARNFHTAVWTGNSMVVWGGVYGTGYFNTGGRYTNPALIGIKIINEKIPTFYALKQNYPNPFNPKTIINFQLPMFGNVKLIVYNILGREITTLVNEQLKPGIYEVEWDGTNYSSGVYFYKIVSGSFSSTKKMVLVK